MLVTSQPHFYNGRFTTLTGAPWETWDLFLRSTAVLLSWDKAVGCSLLSTAQQQEQTYGDVPPFNCCCNKI